MTHLEQSRRGRRSGRHALAVLAPVVAGVLLLTLPESREREEQSAASDTVPVTRSVLGCPPSPGPREPEVTVGLASALAGVGGATSQVRAGAPGGAGEAVPLERGATVELPASAPRGTVVRADGEAARGLFLTRVDRASRSLAVLPCPGPRAGWWFPGAGGGVDHRSEVLLSNVDAGPAVVDLRIHGATSAVDVAATRGITLAPGESTRVRLADVAPQSDEVTVEVAADRGRVVAAVTDRRRAGAGQGREWLPAAVEPAEQVVLTGIPDDARGRQLLVTNPGEQQARVAVEVVNADGAFVPLGAEELSVAPGEVTVVDLGEQLGDGVAGLVLRSDVPVLGTLRSTARSDHAYAAAVPALSGPATVRAAGAGTTVQLVGGEEGGNVDVTAFDTSGRELVTRALEVPAATALTWSLPAQAAYAVVAPGTGQVHAGAVHTVASAGGTAAAPLLEVPLTATRPVVRPVTG